VDSTLLLLFALKYRNLRHHVQRTCHSSVVHLLHTDVVLCREDHTDGCLARPMGPTLLPRSRRCLPRHDEMWRRGPYIRRLQGRETETETKFGVVRVVTGSRQTSPFSADHPPTRLSAVR
jgi:hypothetical protein